MHPPALPRQDAPREREARAVRLRDLEGGDVVAQRCAGRDVEVAALGRDRHDAVVVDAQHLEPVEIDEGDHSVDRMGPFVVAGMRLDEDDAATQPPAVVVGLAEVPGGPGVDLERVEVGDAPACHRRPEVGIEQYERLGLHQLRDDGHRLDVGPPRPGDDLVRSERDERLDRAFRVAVEDHRLGLTARRRAAAIPGEDGVLGRLAQRDRDEPRALAERREAVVCTQDGRHRRQLRSAQRIERMSAGALLVVIPPSLS